MGQVLQIRGIGTWLADGGEGCTQLPARAIENGGCLLQITAMQKQDGKLDVAVCLPQCLARLRAAAPGEPLEYAFAAPHEFSVDGLEVHHKAIVDPAQQDHDHR